MLLRSQTLPFLLFETSAAFYHCSFSLLRLMLTLWLCSFLDFQTVLSGQGLRLLSSLSSCQLACESRQGWVNVFSLQLP